MKRSELLVKNHTKMHLDWIRSMLGICPEFKKYLPFAKLAVVTDETILLKDYSGKYLTTFSTSKLNKALENLYEGI